MKICKIVSIIVLLFITFMVITPLDINAAGIQDPTVKQSGYGKTSTSSTILKNKANVILGVIRNFGIIISVIGFMVLGIRYMLGSVEEKADYKKTLLPFVIGFIVLLLASTIPSIVYKAFH